MGFFLAMVSRLDHPRNLLFSLNQYALRQIRHANLVAPVRRERRARGVWSQSARIGTDAPDDLRGIDSTRFHPREEGWHCFFVAVGHTLN